MVTRVDRKPIIYNTTFLRCIKPAVIASKKICLDQILEVSRGHAVPKVSAREIVDDYEDVEQAFRMFGIDDPMCEILGYGDDDDDDEAIRFARVCIDKVKDMRQLARSEALMEDICKIQAKVMRGVTECYFGTEAVYHVFNRVLHGEIFANRDTPNYKGWCMDTAKRILLTQATYCMIHPVAVNDMANQMAEDMDFRTWGCWDTFKKIETLAIRIGSRKNSHAHSYYAGFNRRGFTPSDAIEDDFALPLTGFCEVQEGVTMHLILGVRYLNIRGLMCVMSHDDCVNLATMAQCYYRVGMYFSRSNGYPRGASVIATTLVRDIASHCCRSISSGKNFSHVIRSMHIMSQGEFNDAFEAEMGTDLGWRERSDNYMAEAKALDPMGPVFHKRATDLANDKTDRLNTCFIYHVFVGDEMQIQDLRTKVGSMTTKVLSADREEWANFIKFTKAYTLCRFMLVQKRKPKCSGMTGMLNDKWADRCLSGMFTMPPRSDWGKVWISGEYKYTEFADTWHLEAQDVAYVVKDSKGITEGKFVSDKKIHSELLMAMTHGPILNTLTGSTASSARARICNRGPVTEVVVTTAPKAENAKPSWKKRVTFAADCEFRKMQAEFDRNCRRVMSFVRGPSLGVDQCVLEKQFADIAEASSMGLAGAICSHDISGWSESMDRDRKFEFESILINMFDKPDMINIKDDWAKINAVVTKQGCKDVVRIDNGSFQGFDGSSSTILHTMILIYCIDTARRAGIMSPCVKTNMATLIDDCIALMVDLTSSSEAKSFWAHLKVMYRKLGFEVDDLKSIFSTIKAIYLSRRFMLGGEVPSDLKVFIKAHSSYEDPLRCTLDIPNDIFGAMRGACDANGEPWFIYFCACVSSLCEIAHNNNVVMSLPPSAAAIFALAPTFENGWGFPSIVSWCTNDVTDKRAHFNNILELLAVHELNPPDFKGGVEVYTKPAGRAVMAIKSQAWRTVSYGSLFTSPFEAIREGPLKPDMLKRNAVQDQLADVATAEPWASLLKWNTSSTTNRVREMLIQSGPLHAPTLAALVNCMPDNYRLSLVGKAVGSSSLLDLLPNGSRIMLKRRVNKSSIAYFRYSKAIYDSTNQEYEAGDVSCLTYIERTIMEREEFYQANGVVMTDHTFPDPIGTFTVVGRNTGSMISPNTSSLRIWDKTKRTANRTSHLIADKGIYVPRRSGRVWEVTNEYAKGWDTVSQRVAMGLAILARAESDGHRVEGLLTYFIKSWNELSNITPKDTHLIAIHGSIKRLDANPGSSTHPIIANRNILRGFNNKLKTALDAIPIECERVSGVGANLHDFLAHETSMLCLTSLMFSTFQFIGVADSNLSYPIGAREGCIVPESKLRMKTNLVSDQICIEIMDGEDNYGLLQSCPSLAKEIAIPTMKSSWVKMINALVDGDNAQVEEMRHEALSTPLDDLIAMLEEDEVYYSTSVILAAEPAARGTYTTADCRRLAIAPNVEDARARGDGYTVSVRTTGSKFSRALTSDQPDHILAATVVRSLLWSRVKDISPVQMSKILYNDPDADLDTVRRCASKDFWRAAIIEVNKLRGKRSLSDMAMAAFRSLGVIELHIRHSTDVAEVTQSVASFFGAHLRSVTVIISDLISSLAGRSHKDYEKPFAERIVTNNPSSLNAKMRREHVNKLIKSNIEMYKDRVDKLIAGEATHRGDKRAHDQKKRIIELRCRMYVYMSVNVADSGMAVVDGRKFGQIEYDAAKRIWDRKEMDIETLPEAATTFEGALEFMFDVDARLVAENEKHGSGWDAQAGSLGARLAHSLIDMDANMIMGTKYAVSAAEIAPKVHKRAIRTEKGTHVVKEVEPELATDVPSAEIDDDDDLFAMDDETAARAMLSSTKSLPFELWKALYTLVLGGFITTDDLNSKLGTSMPSTVTHGSLREAHLDDFTDADITAAFPSIVADYTGSGAVFDPEWLNRDEADAYTTDELSKGSVGFLF